MRKIIIPVIVGLLFSLNAFSQVRGLEAGMELNGGHGTDRYTRVSVGMDAIIGYRLGSAFFLGAGFGAEYCDGLSTALIGPGEYSGAITDICWSLRGFARAKYNVTKTAVSPFLLLDGGYAFRILNPDAPQNVEGLFYEPAVGADFSVFGLRLSAMIGYKRNPYEYEQVIQPSSGRGTYKSSRAGSWRLHLGISF